MKKVSIKEIALIGIMAAAVYVSSAFLQIPIPTAIDNTRLHMGNVMCLLSGLLLGAFSYVVLYLAKSFIEHRFVLGLPIDAVLLTVSQKAVVSGINAVVAVVVAVPLAAALRPALNRYSAKEN